MKQQWTPAPYAGTSKVALQSQLGVKGSVAPLTPLRRLWAHIGRSGSPPADWSERFYRYSRNRTADNKQQLPAVNVSTICEGVNGAYPSRRIENVARHSGLVVLDYDDVSDPHALTAQLRRSNHTIGVFVSPSGDGVKAIVPVSPIPTCVNDHAAAFKHAEAALKPITKEYVDKADQSGKDPVRLMFAYAHTPFRGELNDNAEPIPWWPLDDPPAKPVVVETPLEDELVELEAHLRKLDLSKREIWLPAMGAARTAGFGFEQWNAIASDSPGYVDTKEQRRRWDEDVKRGRAIHPKTIFKIAKDQDKLTPSKQKRPVASTGGSKTPTSAKGPAKGSKPSKAKETASTGKGEPKAAPETASKSNQVLMAREFAKHCDESTTPSRYWPNHGWMRYGEHGWGEDPDNAGLWQQLMRWAESPAGVELQAPLSKGGLEGVFHLARKMLQHSTWDVDGRVGLPERGVMALNQDASVNIDHGDWKSYISKRTGAMLGTGDTPEDALWERCINEWMPAVEVASYVQTLLGAALFGHAVETRSVLYIQSSSQYGKSTFLNAVRNAFGQYADMAPAETFTKKYGGDDKLYQIALMEGVRLVMAPEIPRGLPWNAARIKALSGGEQVVGRHPYQRAFTFMPQFLLVLSGNHDPSMTGGESEGMKQRMRIVRWPKRGFSKPDRQLTDKLATPAARAAILRWVVSGAQHYMAGGMPETPESMQAVTKAYFKTADWFVDYCQTLKFNQPDDETIYHTPIRELTDHYNSWCVEEGIPESKRAGSRKMNQLYSEKGCTKVTHRINGRPTACMAGVAIAHPIEPQPISQANDKPANDPETTEEAPF